MPTVRFVREEKDVICLKGENLREVAMREGLQLYGFKGKLSNCGGYGQCITCFVAVFGGNQEEPLSPLTELEKIKLRNKPSNWRLACQALVNSSVIVLTRPQAPLKNSNLILEAAQKAELPS